MDAFARCSKGVVERNSTWVIVKAPSAKLTLYDCDPPPRLATIHTLDGSWPGSIFNIMNTV